MLRFLSCLAIGTAVLFNVSPATAAGDKREVKGTFTLVDSAVRGGTTGCYGSGGYDDIQSGLRVVVRDQKGKIRATSSLGVGVRPPGQFATVTCEFPFKVKVPDSKFYAFEVGSRGELAYSAKEMKQMKWRVAFRLS